MKTIAIYQRQEYSKDWPDYFPGFKEPCDVFVYEMYEHHPGDHGCNYRCGQCSLSRGIERKFFTVEELRQHLVEHRKAGARIPEAAFAQLLERENALR